MVPGRATSESGPTPSRRKKAPITVPDPNRVKTKKAVIIEDREPSRSEYLSGVKISDYYLKKLQERISEETDGVNVRLATDIEHANSIIREKGLVKQVIAKLNEEGNVIVMRSDDINDAIADLQAQIGGGGASDTQTAYSTTLLFTGNLVSSFGDTTNNRHSQTAAIVFTYDFTGAVEGATRVLEITSNGDDITVPTGVAKSGFLNNNSTTLLSVDENVITPENGKTYQFIFWYVNGYVNIVIIDSEFITVDTNPPVYTVAPAITNLGSTSFDVTATINEIGTTYTVVLADGATAPTPAEVKAGTGSGGAAVEGSGNQADSGSGVTISITGLTASTNYDVYVVSEDDSGNIQAAVTALAASTPASVSLPDLSGLNMTEYFGSVQTVQSTVLAPYRIVD